MKLYYNKKENGAEYLTDTYINWTYKGENKRVGVINQFTKYSIRIDGDITQDRELCIRKQSA